MRSVPDTSPETSPEPGPDESPDTSPATSPETSSAASTPALAQRRKAALPHVRRVLAGRFPVSPVDEFRSVTDELEASGCREWDRYGEDGPVAVLEGRVAALLGKPAAVMFPSGTMAQQATLRVWCEGRGSRRVGIPALSHLLLHEEDGPRLLGGFEWALLTSGPVVPTAEHLAAVPGRLGAVLTELPLRDAGYLLPTWEQLVELGIGCRERDVPLHLDGARIWESAAGYGRDVREVAAVGDSVYVSFYKGLLGLGGSVVAGPVELVEELRLWRRRYGGTLWTMLPYAVTALRGLREELPRMGEYHQRALEIAAALHDKGFRTFPEVPHTDAFRLFVERPAEEVTERVVSLMETERVALTGVWRDSEDVPGWSWTEFGVGRPAMDWAVEEAVDLLARTLSS